MWTSTVTQSTPSTMTRTITTRAICTSEHSSAPLIVFHVSLIMCHTTLAQVHWVFHITSSACRTCVVVFDSLRPLSLLQPVLSRLLPLLCPDVPWPADRPLRPGLRGKWPAPLRQGEPRRLLRHPLPHSWNGVQRFITQHTTLDRIDGEPMEFEWNIFPGFITLQLCSKVQEFMSKMSDPSEFKGRIIFMSMFNDIIWGSEDNERECKC